MVCAVACLWLLIHFSAAVVVLAADAASCLTGVGHPDGTEEQPLSDVRSPDARSAQIRSPDGVALSFQVSANNVEPREASPARNLLSKDDWRAALADEAEPLGPEVALVGEAEAGTGAGERLAWAASGPDGAVVGPPGEAKGVGPGAEAGEGVKLGSAHNVICAELTDGTNIDTPAGDVPGVGEVAEPRRGVGLDLVVERHLPRPAAALTARRCARATAAAASSTGSGPSPHIQRPSSAHTPATGAEGGRGSRSWVTRAARARARHGRSARPPRRGAARGAHPTTRRGHGAASAPTAGHDGVGDGVDAQPCRPP